MSRNKWLSTFEVGERRYVETSATGYAADMRSYHQAKSRRPAYMRDMEFTTKLFTAVGTGVEFRYLICVERTA